eukprot:scaffold124713_cov36-Phaeocystis_antarctica.AAC.1
MYEPPEGTDLPWEAAAAAAEAAEAAKAAKAAKAAAAAEAAEAEGAEAAGAAEGTEAKAEGGGTAADAKAQMRRQSTELRQSAGGEKGAALASTVQLRPEDGNVQEQLRDILIDNAVRVIDLFRDWDDDEDGKVSKKEFRKAMVALGLKVPKKDADALFDTFDPDGGGSIDYNELNKALKRKVALDPSLQAGAVTIELSAKNKSSKDKMQAAGGKAVAANRVRGEKGAALNSNVQIDPDGNVQEQLRQILIDNAVRVIDLFRDWDDDGDGKVSKKEFRKAMVALGLDVPRKDVDALFDTFDPDGGGSIDYNELNKALKRRVALDPSLRVGSMGTIELKAQNKSSRDLQGVTPRQPPSKVERQATQHREAAAVVAAAAKVAAKIAAKAVAAAAAAAEEEAVEAALELERRQA